MAAGSERDLKVLVNNENNYRKAKSYFFYGDAVRIVNELNRTEILLHDIAIIELENEFEFGERTGTHRVLHFFIV